MDKAESTYQKLLENCKYTIDGLIDFNDPEIYADVIELFHLLYKQAFNYFRSRHAEDSAEELATQAAQTVWENLLNCKSLSGIRQGNAFYHFAKKSVVYECWRLQKNFEKEKIIDDAQDGSVEDEDDDDWLEMLIDRNAPAAGAEFLDPQSLIRQLIECLTGAIKRLKNLDHRLVIILRYLADLDDQKLALLLNKPANEIQKIRAQARAHGLDANALSNSLGISGREMQSYLDQLRHSGLPDESIAHICGIVIDRVQSLRSRTKKMKASEDYQALLASVFHLTPEDMDGFRVKLKDHLIREFEIALAFECVQAEKDGSSRIEKGDVAEDYEIALILGTTRSNVQAMFSRAKQSLKEDPLFGECIGVE